MTPWTRLLGAVFAGLLTMTAIGVGHGRGQPPVAGQMILCHGQDVVVVPVDVAGRPVPVVFNCPDCALTAFVDLPGAGHFGTVPWTDRLMIFDDLMAWFDTLKRTFDRPFVRGPPAGLV
ncbi:hypothetical protein [Actibacterium sp. 188UL27-1]|uniref:hypothetical protein n=1 Tax=Actibacterium sp. 188UL27-1 TaxID=2786961 RepID=UPI00195CFD53|nr:hypothetical protein [Actibacterium sp. 188UL27-1]MBM7066423.1 hypothetical protein [Actibacterium sp. 188UL27-1]